MNGSFCNLCALALGWRYISSLHCADELQQERNSCPQLRSCFIDSGHVGVPKHISRSISLAVYCLYKKIMHAFHRIMPKIMLAISAKPNTQA